VAVNPDSIPVCLFVRVSTSKQDYDRQIFELTTYAQQHHFIIVKTIASIISGTKANADRPDVQELFTLAQQRVFKKVIVSEISRLGRRAKDIRYTLDYLHQRGISVVFKNLGGLESLMDGKESFVTNIIIAIYSELAQEEKRILSERVKSGLNNALKKGKQIGRPNGSAKNKAAIIQQYSPLIKDLQAGLSLSKCCKIHQVSKNTVIKIKKLYQQSVA
jgi:DNA invertase Pin-like site-specific DNA recombinase